MSLLKVMPFSIVMYAGISSPNTIRDCVWWQRQPGSICVDVSALLVSFSGLSALDNNPREIE
jgi:hypothetical protein